MKEFGPNQWITNEWPQLSEDMSVFQWLDIQYYIYINIIDGRITHRKLWLNIMERKV